MPLAKINIWDNYKLKSTIEWCIKNFTGWRSLTWNRFRKSKFFQCHFYSFFVIAPSEMKIQSTLVSSSHHPERKILWHTNKKRGIPSINRKNKTSLCATKIQMIPYWDNLIMEKGSHQIPKQKEEQEGLERKPLKDKAQSI